jgi:hypothetical protein
LKQDARRYNSTFKVKAPERKPAKVYESYTPKARAKPLRIADGKARCSVAVPKTVTIQHRGYMDLVREMHCIRCMAPPRSQFCHSDEGKGIGFKSDCRLGWPGCAACHYAVGTERIYPKEERRALEAEYARKTRAVILAAGMWPKDLPLWDEA